jgi:hypothetical protein
MHCPAIAWRFAAWEDFEFNVDNFPPAHRVGRYADLLFLPIRLFDPIAQLKLARCNHLSVTEGLRWRRKISGNIAA